MPESAIVLVIVGLPATPEPFATLMPVPAVIVRALYVVAAVCETIPVELVRFGVLGAGVGNGVSMLVSGTLRVDEGTLGVKI